MSIYDQIAGGGAVSDVGSSITQGMKQGDFYRDKKEDSAINEVGKFYQQKAIQEGKPFSDYKDSFIRDVYAINPTKAQKFEADLTSSGDSYKVLPATFDESTKTGYFNYLANGKVISQPFTGQPIGLANTDRKQANFLPNEMTKSQLAGALNVYNQSVNRHIAQGGDPNDIPDFYSSLGFIPVVDGKPYQNFSGIQQTNTANTNPNAAPAQGGITQQTNTPPTQGGRLPTTKSDTDIKQSEAEIAADKAFKVNAQNEYIEGVKDWNTKQAKADELIADFDKILPNLDSEGKPLTQDDANKLNTLSQATGLSKWTTLPTSKAGDVKTAIKNIIEGETMQGISAMKGYGVLSDRDLEAIRKSITTLNSGILSDEKSIEELRHLHELAKQFKVHAAQDLEAKRLMAERGRGYLLNKQDASAATSKQDEKTFTAGLLKARPNLTIEQTHQAYQRYLQDN